MNVPRQVLLWVAAAVAGFTLLLGVIHWHDRYNRTRYASFLAGDPHEGAHLFERKQCAHCHSVGGVGGRIGPDLGFEFRPKSSMNQLVSAMWNHAPQMWERIRSEKIAYPLLDQEETAHLFAYLYTARYVDEPGDAGKGRALFDGKQCSRCHSVRGIGGDVAPDLAELKGIDTPILWAQAMWNHGPAMEAAMQKIGVEWPRFQSQEMNDLLAYVRQVTSGARKEGDLLPADPKRGWRVFQEKQCISCHSVGGSVPGGSGIAPHLGPRPGFAPTIVQFAGAMWNHSPQMWRAMKAGGIPRPVFEGQEMADVIAFLYGIRYFEPAGEPGKGAQVFASSGCSRCHGADARGSREAPALRRAGRGFNTIALAEALWRHGPRMYERTQQMSLPWPTLQENDVGDLVAFLNAGEERRR